MDGIYHYVLIELYVYFEHLTYTLLIQLFPIKTKQFTNLCSLHVWQLIILFKHVINNYKELTHVENM